LYAEERQQEILTRARQHGRVEVETLSRGFEVSSETIRRDLNSLEQAGVLRRVHGGAIPIERLSLEFPLAQRDRLMTQEKDAIAQLALSQLPPGGAILLDAGSTTSRLAQCLPADVPLTVVTNSPAIGLLLAQRDDLTVMLLGGRIRKKTSATVDGWAHQATSQIHVDVAFMATNGLSVSRGLTTPDPAEASIKRSMIASARRVVLLADHTKLDNDCFAKFGELSDVDLLVTDSGLGDAALQELRQAGLDTVCANPLER
jgi:DeoR family transcriptional regulator, fructose operon transcriptional repressor